MAKYRRIETQIWSDTWFEELDAQAKFLYLYLITNDKIDQAGIFETSRRKIAFETGLKEEDLNAIFQNLKAKVTFDGKFVWVKNFTKYQSQNSKFMQGAINCLQKYSMDTVSAWLSHYDTLLIQYGYCIETICKQYGYCIDTVRYRPLSVTEAVTDTETEAEYKQDKDSSIMNDIGKKKTQPVDNSKKRADNSQKNEFEIHISELRMKDKEPDKAQDLVRKIKEICCIVKPSELVQMQNKANRFVKTDRYEEEIAENVLSDLKTQVAAGNNPKYPWDYFVKVYTEHRGRWERYQKHKNKSDKEHETATKKAIEEALNEQ